jgi:Family of unknown function (DUF6781)
MSTTTDRNAAVKAQAEQIVTSGTDIRPRLSEVVAQNAGESRQSGGLVALVRAVMDGAREGLARAVPQNRDDALRQVVDALGDGLSRAALAGQLALQEADASSRQFAKEDLARLHDDLTAVRDLFAETVERGLTAGKALTAGQVAAARRHAERVAERLKPAVAGALDAVRQHPVAFAREGLQAGVSAGQGAAGALFQALGRMLQRAGDQMRQEGEPGK